MDAKPIAYHIISRKIKTCSLFLVILVQTAPLSGANIGVWHRAHALGAERDLQ